MLTTTHPSTSAFADERLHTTTPAASAELAPSEIEQLEDAYREALSSSFTASTKVAAFQRRIAVLEARVPEMQEKSDEAVREMYKLQTRKYEVVEMLLSSETLVDFIQQYDYLESIARSNTNSMAKWRQARERLSASYGALEEARALADERKYAAQQAFIEETAERVAKQKDGIEQAQKQAATLGGESSVGKDGSGNDQPEDFKIAASSDIDVLDDGVNWNTTEEEFIAEWAPRLDAYLAGSPLAGQGKNFARSAWRYCIDPRWSAAISNTESSKGTYCIRPHNAWGWGAADSNPYALASEWSSWEEAIDAHARGLARGYGYTITINGAKKYCPYTWQSWYNNTLNQMASI